MSATHQMQNAMQGVSKAMVKCSKFISLPQLQESIRKYQMESEKMSMKQEMVSDAMDDAFDQDSDAEDELVQKVMDEMTLDLREDLVDAPSKKKEVVEEKQDDDLQA